MESKELRIGNWVLTEDGKYAHITGIQEFSKTTLVMAAHEQDTLIGSVLPLTFKPITLTPEILEKCGFKKDSYEDVEWWYLKTTYCEFLSCDDGVSVIADFNRPDNLKITSLHQLQNLIFSLTGVELSIDLK